MHRFPLRRLTGGLVALACLAATSASAANPARLSLAPRLSDSRLRAIALTAAKADGDAHPTVIQYAEGSRRMANLVASDEVVNATNRSYLIAERGNFGTPTISSPPGIPMGPGPVRIIRHVITLVVDARTGKVTDSGLSDRYPDLTRLGRVTTLHRG